MKSDNVTGRVLNHMREAMLGGTPILYIRTDSDRFVRGLVENTEAPLVVPMSTAPDFNHRPYGEYLSLGKSTGGAYEKQSNIIELTANGPDPGKDRDVSRLSKRMKLCQFTETLYSVEWPTLWWCRVTKENCTELISALERYVDCLYSGQAPRALSYSVFVLYSAEPVRAPGTEQETELRLLPPGVMAYTEVIDVPKPNAAEIRDIILRETRRDPLIESIASELAESFIGMPEEEIILGLQRCMIRKETWGNAEKMRKVIQDKKKQYLQGGLLELVVPDDGEIAGMDDFRAWLSKQESPIKNAEEYRRQRGTLPPKGVLLCGIPGCGKSEAAKLTAKKFGLPLLKLDIGSMMNKYIGTSEEKLRISLRQAEEMSPCVLWIDELEKGFSGASGDGGDGGTFKRMFGYLLNWMQENTAPCFLFATANDLGGLPKEFFRSGRFDELFAVYLPIAEECASILKECMRRASDKAKKAAGQAGRRPVQIFKEDCFKDHYLCGLIDSLLVESANGTEPRVRIVIGSDIRKLVDYSLRLANTDGFPLSCSEWKFYLREALKECAVYGDSDENVSSIVVSYCRLLRKGFKPTTAEGKILFRKEDYHVDHYREIKDLMNRPAAENDEAAKKRDEKLERLKNSMLSVRKPASDHAYDQTVYALLQPQINWFSLQVEEVEWNRMLGTKH